MSSDSPNFQNIPSAFEITPPAGLPAIPNMRDFILPEEGCEWVSRDYAAQEVRLLAHFENGDLEQEFLANPFLDPHERVAELISGSTGVEVTRSQAKGIAFGIIYGMGPGTLGSTLGVNSDYARFLIDAYYESLPGVTAFRAKAMAKAAMKSREYEVKSRRAELELIRAQREDAADDKERKSIDFEARVKKMRYEKAAQKLQRLRKQTKKGYVRTIGGRRIYPEPPKLIGNKVQTFEYKILNYLIQGSAADQTKRAMLRWFRNKSPYETFMAAVHDEMNISAPVGSTGQSLKNAMENDPLVDVPMVTTLKTGSTWGNINGT